MRLGHLLGQILPIVQNASAASTVTGGFCLFSQVSLPGSEKLDPGNSREFPGIPIPGNSHFRSLAYYSATHNYLNAPAPLNRGTNSPAASSGAKPGDPSFRPPI